MTNFINPVGLLYCKSLRIVNMNFTNLWYSSFAVISPPGRFQDFHMFMRARLFMPWLRCILVNTARHGRHDLPLAIGSGGMWLKHSWR
jgi:hypothetical protein